MNDAAASVALRESEELHRITLLSMSDAVFITDDDGVFTFICPNVDVIFGYGHDEVRTMNRISRLLGHDLVERERLAATGEIRNIEHEAVIKGGLRRVLLVHIKQVAIKGGTTLYVCRDITERKEAEHTIRRNEARLTLALEAASMGTWDWDLPSGEMSWSPETHRILGDSLGVMTPSFDSFLELLSPADRDRVSRTMTDAIERDWSYETEFRVAGNRGVDRWVMGKGKVLRNGKPLRMLGVFVDFTERHRVEEELRELGGRLINAHEQERIRLSRDLHDDLAQRVSILAADLSLLHQERERTPGDISDRLAKLLDETAEIGSELHRFSHELHPARVGQLGLESSIRRLCQELEEARQIAVDVEIDQTGALAPEVALCLYRIAQEALHNVVKHGATANAMLTLSAAGNEVRLSVVDRGAGFDPLVVEKKDTLGLVSMRERVRLVDGQLRVTSKPGEGTRVDVRVPLR
jgi:PAS domain S-box-containing protein